MLEDLQREYGLSEVEPNKCIAFRIIYSYVLLKAWVKMKRNYPKNLSHMTHIDIPICVY